MPSAAYSFIDVAVLDGVRERFAAGDAIVILSAGLDEVVWANGPGAALFGHPDIESIIGADSGLGFAARRQIAATRGFPHIGKDRGIAVRLAQGIDSRAVMFSASAIALPDSEDAIMLAVPAGLAGAPEKEIAARAIGGFTQPGHLVAFLDQTGAVEAASGGFVARDIPAAVLADLAREVAGERGRLIKKIIPAGVASLPAGIARLRDEPARHLLVVIDEVPADDSRAEDATAVPSAPSGDVNLPFAAAEETASGEPAEITADEPATLLDAGENGPGLAAEILVAASNADAPTEATDEYEPPAALEEVEQAALLPADADASFADEGVDAVTSASATESGHADEHPVPSIEDVWGPQEFAPEAASLMDADISFTAADNRETETAEAAQSEAIDLSGEVAEESVQSADADDIVADSGAAIARTTAETIAASPPEPEAERRAPEEPVANELAAAEIDRNAAPVRFVWKTDATGRFSAVSPEFLAAVGTTSEELLGRPFGEVSETLGLDRQKEIVGLLERRDTWSGRSVSWPIAGTGLKVPVDLAALPVYSRDRTFEGFRGFGVARLADSFRETEAAIETPPLPATTEAAGSYGTVEHPENDAEAEATPQLTVPASPDVATETSGTREAEPPRNDTKGVDPFQGEVPALSIAPKPDRRSSDKIIRLAEHRPSAPEKGLSTVERSAFREIGERLRKAGGIEDEPATTAAMDAPGEAANDDIRRDEQRAGGEDVAAVSLHDEDRAPEAESPRIDGLSSDPSLDAIAAPDDSSAETVQHTGPSFGVGLADHAEVPVATVETRPAEITTIGQLVADIAAAEAETVSEPTAESVPLTTAQDEPAHEPTTELVEAPAGAAHDAVERSQPAQPYGVATTVVSKPEPVSSYVDTIVVAVEETADGSAVNASHLEAASEPAWQGVLHAEESPPTDTFSVGDGGQDTAAPLISETTVASAEASDLSLPEQNTVLSSEPAPEQASEEMADQAPAEIRAEDPPAAADLPEQAADMLAPHAEEVPASAMDGLVPVFDGPNEGPGEVVEALHEGPQIAAAGETTLPPAEVDTPSVSPVVAARAAIFELKTGGYMPSAFSPAPSGGRRFQDTAILSRLPVPLLIHSGDVLHYANDEFLGLTGYGSLDRLRDAGGLGALFTNPYDEARDEAGRALRLKTADGLEFPIEAILRSVPWNGGHALMLVVRRTGDAVEVDDTREPLPNQPDAEALKARVAEMRAIIDTATDGVILITNDGAIRSISRPAEALFGFESDELGGKPFTALFAIESQRAARDYLNGLSDHGVASVLNDGREVIGRESQGRFIPLFMTIGKLPGDSGFCAVVRDITQWKRAEEELTQARSLAERASSQKSEFLARISHEIRTPLNAIIGFSELMVDERFGPIGNDRYRDYLQDINRSGNHVLELVNDLLDISKIEAGEQEMAHEAVSLNETLGQTVAMMQPQANRERVIIRSSFASRLPEVVADARSVRQIALNLLSNAVRYTQAGGQVIVSTAYEPSGDVVMRVRDTGIGMTQAEIEQALKPFKQINALKRSRGDGTGLGLPLTKAMVEANRARFTINSTPGEGTLVEVTFPSTRVLAN